MRFGEGRSNTVLGPLIIEVCRLLLLLGPRTTPTPFLVFMSLSPASKYKGKRTWPRIYIKEVSHDFRVWQVQSPYYRLAGWRPRKELTLKLEFKGNGIAGRNLLSLGWISLFLLTSSNNCNLLTSSNTHPLHGG